MVSKVNNKQTKSIEVKESGSEPDINSVFDNSQKQFQQDDLENGLTTRFLQKREAGLDRQTLRLAQALISAGFKVTDPRLAVIEEVVKFNREFEITELSQRLEDRSDYKPGIASVFRSVKLLTELGLLQRVHSADGCHRYSLLGSDSHHVVCRCCDRTIDFEGCDFKELTDFLQKKTGFNLEGHWLEFFGLCQECQHATSQTTSLEKLGNLNLIKPLPHHEHHLDDTTTLERTPPLSVRAISQV